MQPPTRDAFRRLLAQGWMDCTCELHPKERMYTYWVSDDAFRHNKGFRLDFLLLSPALQPRLTAAGVDREYRVRDKPSDHTPAWIQLAA